ncbi:Leucine-rich repeat containing protein [Entamoeba marina]
MTIIGEYEIAHIIMYLKTFENVEKLIQINKKCKNVVETIRINPNYSMNNKELESPEDIFQKQRSFAKYFEIFPHLQHFNFQLDYCCFINLLPSSITSLSLPNTSTSFINYSLEKYPFKLVELSLNSSEFPFNFQQCKYLTKLTIYITNDISLLSLPKLEVLYLICSIPSLNLLYSTLPSSFQIPKIIINCLDIIPSIQFPTHITVISPMYYHSIPKHVIPFDLLLPTTFQIDTENLIENDLEILQQHLPISISLYGNQQPFSMNFNSFTSIQIFHIYTIPLNVLFPTSITELHSISFPTLSTNQNISIDSIFPSLLSLHLSEITNVITLPQTLTLLELKQSNCKISNLHLIHLKEFDCENKKPLSYHLCTSLTTLKLDQCIITKSLHSLKQLKELFVTNCTFTYKVKLNMFYPTPLKTLFCLTSTLPPYSNITELVLMNSTTSLINLEKYQKLQKLSIGGILSNNLLIPTSIHQLNFIQITNNITYSIQKLINLQTVVITNSSYFNLQFPSQLNTLILENISYTIDLSNLHLKRLGIINCPNIDLLKVNKSLYDIYVLNNPNHPININYYTLFDNLIYKNYLNLL